jgi:hypothetical protein
MNSTGDAQKKRKALFYTVLVGCILIIIFFIQISQRKPSTDSQLGPQIKDFYTTILDTTQQYFQPEK